MRPLIAALVLLPGTALASGYYYSDSGIVATGRGGAWIAGADTQFAQFHNPAGLIRIDRPTLNLGWSGVQQATKWTQQGQCADQLPGSEIPECAAGDATFQYDPVQNTAAPFSVPQIGFAMPVGDKFALAIGFTSPYAPSGEWDPEGPQRYTIVDSAIYQFGIGPSMAWQPIPAVTFGAGIQVSYLQVGRSLNLTMTGYDDPGGDIFVDARAVDPFTPTWNLGLLVEPTEDVSFGFSLTPPTSYRAKGTLDVNFEGNQLEAEFNPTRYEDDDVSLAIDLPLVLKAGVAVRPTSKLEVEFAWVWQQWSSLSEIVIDDVNMTVGFNDDSFLNGMIPEEDRTITGPFELPAGLRDAASYRLGGEYTFNEFFEARAGGFYEPAAVPEELVTVSLVDASKWQIGTGASFTIPDTALRFDLAFAYLFFQDLEIRDSKVAQVNAGVFECPQDTQTGVLCRSSSIIGNGDTDTYGWIVGVQGQYSFGQARE